MEPFGVARLIVGVSLRGHPDLRDESDLEDVSCANDGATECRPLQLQPFLAFSLAQSAEEM